MHPYIKHSKQGFIKRGLIICSGLIVSGCSTVKTNTVQVQDLSFQIPTTLTSISSQSLDNAQIAHTIIGAWKDSNSSLILSESSLPSSISMKEFQQQAVSRVAQQMAGYAKISEKSQSFTCNGTKIVGYTHEFVQRDLKDSDTTLQYYSQYSFPLKGSVYIISLAQKEKKSIFNDIITSLTCKQ